MNLESLQVYGSKYLNPPDHPAERKILCGYCLEVEVEEEGQSCEECSNSLTR